MATPTLYLNPSAAGGPLIQAAGNAIRYDSVSGGVHSFENQSGGFSPCQSSAFNVVSTLRQKRELLELAAPTSLAQVLDTRVRPLSFRHTWAEHRTLGFGAEDLIHVVPEAVQLDEDGDPWSINYIALVPILWGAVRELSAKLDAVLEKTA